MNFVFFIFLMFASLFLTSDENMPVNIEKCGVRDVFFSVGFIGIPDVLSTEIGFQINKNWSISGSTSVYAISGGFPGATLALGLTVNRYLDKTLLRLFNNIALEILTPTDFKQGMFELTIGNKQVYNKTITFSSAIGISGAIPFIKQENTILFLPVLRWGMSVNF